MSTIEMTTPEFLTIPLSDEAHKWAHKFASAQMSLDKKKQVYLNTLAVYAVHTYLKWVQVKTDLENSDSWNLSINAFFDVCDLEVPNIGKLVCCPILPDEDSFKAPELLPDSIAYVAVKFKEVLDEVDILGYRPIIPGNTPETVDLDFLDDEDVESGYDDGSSLFPIENLLSWMFYIQDIKERIEQQFREYLENDEVSLSAGIRQVLEEQLNSLSQVATQAVYIVKTQPDSLFSECGKNLLVGYSSAGGTGNKTRNQLNSSLRGGSQVNSQMTDEETDTDKQLEEIGSELLHLVKQIINDYI
ncbi:MAG: DUF1822 family protein [Sphaerospermopsis kisseleviana]